MSLLGEKILEVLSRLTACFLEEPQSRCAKGFM